MNEHGKDWRHSGSVFIFYIIMIGASAFRGANSCSIPISNLSAQRLELTAVPMLPLVQRTFFIFACMNVKPTLKP